MKKNSLLFSVLVVEDDCILQKIHTIYLEKLGYSVETASTGLYALNLHNQKRYGAILLDLGLPDISGENVLKIIRNRERISTIHTPIILVTAHGLPEDRTHYLNQGATAYFNKPISKEILGATLVTWM